ncbi:MAG: 16S rRNA (cytidine(1402)-2'-O)-methyltransferase [Methylococcales bacterium]|nr:16S rRNA (cytidine(1402)-2'-O)-methyltransferase [Methylococcales bacterium]
MSVIAGQLYVVATPIGNLGDLSPRAVEVLQSVALIVAEDTRHARVLLGHFAITTPVRSLHQHNEDRESDKVLAELGAGRSVAVIADAGTPLINDPGLIVVQKARAQGLTVIAVPGPCALVAALSVAGLPLNRFIFEGFAPRSGTARAAFFSERRDCSATWVFYESSHRILDTLVAMTQCLPPQRKIVVAKELTKMHERVLSGSAAELLAQFQALPELQKGEFVVLVEPAPASVEDKTCLTEQQCHVLERLLAECSLKTAVALTVHLTGARKSLVYQTALALQKQHEV